MATAEPLTPGVSPFKGSLSPPTASLPVAVDISVLETSSRILQIIDRYRLNQRYTPENKADESALKFLVTIYTQVKSKAPSAAMSASVSFKSPNSTSKVLGKLPDKAEEFALARLNGLCLSIRDIYAPGARLTIISDGLVYNDLLGVPDKDVWAYGESLREMAMAKGFNNISFLGYEIWSMIPLPEDLNEMVYVANASNFRRALLNTFSRPDWSWDVVRENEDACLTYCGYIKFLELDLQDVFPLGQDRSRSKYKKGLEYIARQMMARGDAFARAVHQKYGDHIRLSIHPSTSGNKISVAPLPTDTIYTTPWHCCIAFKLDGTTTTGTRAEFEKDSTLELVYQDGQPSFFREKSPLFSWAEEKGGIVCEPLYPAGVLIRPAGGPKALAMDDVDASKVRALSEINSPVVMRGFVKRPNQDSFVKKAREFGEPLPWKFGLVLEVKDRGTEGRGLNNVLSAEWMPFHYDGLFKTVKVVDESTQEERLVSTPPRFQFFMGATSSPKDTGFTIISSSTMVFKHLPSWLSVEGLSEMTWAVSTSSFDQTVLGDFLSSFATQRQARRASDITSLGHKSKTSFDPTEVTIEGNAQGAVICEAIDQVLHDRRVAYYHTWEKGDLLISDNILTLHTRSDFTSGIDRELWRIHFD